MPDGDDSHAKVEVRFRGPNVMPGYWREPALSAEAFDEEGFYRTGDAVRWVDPDRPGTGLLFDGRIAEDFKLDTGTFVSVGPLRAKVVAEGAPCIQDVVVTGLNRSDIGVMLFPRLDECRAPRRPAGRRRARPGPAAAASEGPRVLPGSGRPALGHGHRQRQSRRPRHRAGRAAGDRQGRGHRQGLDQPARRARAARRAGRSASRRDGADLLLPVKR